LQLQSIEKEREGRMAHQSPLKLDWPGDSGLRWRQRLKGTINRSPTWTVAHVYGIFYI